MEILSTLSDWIATNESLLSGIAALIAVVGVIVSSTVFAARKLRKPKDSHINQGKSERTGNQHSESDATTTSLSFQDLIKPSLRPIHFAGPEGQRVAYVDEGEGEPAMVLCPGIISHLHIAANLPSLRDSISALANLGRLIRFDKRGQGLSDPVLGTPTLERRSDEILEVMDHAGVEKAILIGTSEGGPMSIQFAHRHPDRVLGMVLIGSTASWVQRDDYPIGIPAEVLDLLPKLWGKASLRQLFYPALSRDLVSDETYSAMERLLTTRGDLRNLIEFMKETDVRPLLPTLRHPTLVVHFSGDLAVPSRMGRDLAAGIPDAVFKEFAVTDHADLTRSPEAIAAISDFYSSIRSSTL